jgi:hypothetical protein
VSLEVKHRQLARQVGVFIEHQPENSMASFDFTSVVLDKSTTFVFSSWICVANGSGGFNIHLADTGKPEASAATLCSNLDEFIDTLDEMLLPKLAEEIEKMFILNATLTCAAPRLSGSDSNQSEEGCTRLSHPKIFNFRM